VVAHPKMTSGQIEQKICAEIVKMMIDSWLFYLIVLGFGFLAIYLMDIGIFK